jgi:phosphoglycolate phosphatase
LSGVPPVSVVCCGLIGITVDDSGILDRAFTEAFATQGIVPGTGAYARGMVRVHQSKGQSAVDVFRGLFPDAPGRAEAATLAFDRSYRSSVDRSGLVPMPGAEQAISEIRAAGACICLITSLPRSLLGLVLDTLGWSRRVDLVLSSQDVTRGYPWPDLMLTAMLQLGVTDVRDAVFAGGTESGILSGKRSGAGIVAGILTGGHTAGRLRGAGATHLLNSIAELPALLASQAGEAGRAGQAGEARQSSPASGSTAALP